MHVVFYILFLNKFDVFEPLAKFQSLRECKKYEMKLNHNRKNFFHCDQLKDEHISKPFDYFYRKLNTFKNTRKEMKTLPIVLEDIAQMEHYVYRLTLQNNTLSRLCNA